MYYRKSNGNFFFKINLKEYLSPKQNVGFFLEKLRVYNLYLYIYLQMDLILTTFMLIR